MKMTMKMIYTTAPLGRPVQYTAIDFEGFLGFLGFLGGKEWRKGGAKYFFLEALTTRI